MIRQLDRKLNETALVQILIERGPFLKATVKAGLKQRFRNQKPRIQPAGPDITRSNYLATFETCVFVNNYISNPEYIVYYRNDQCLVKYNYLANRGYEI